MTASVANLTDSRWASEHTCRALPLPPSIDVERPIFMGGNISWAGNPGLNKAEGSRYVSLCFLTVDAVLRAAGSPAAAASPPGYSVPLVAFLNLFYQNRMREKAKTLSLPHRL